MIQTIPKTFYMVIRGLNENHATMKRHETYEEAKAEATRLCLKEYGQFFILKAIEYVEYPIANLKWQTL